MRGCVYILCLHVIMQTSHGFEERISGMDDGSNTGDCDNISPSPSYQSSEESAKQWNWKMQLNFTAHWLCHHELFIKMCNAQRFVTTNQLYQHSCSLSNQPQYNIGACSGSGMLTSYLLQYSYNRYSEQRVIIIITILIII